MVVLVIKMLLKTKILNTVNSQIPVDHQQKGMHFSDHIVKKVSMAMV